MRLEISFGGPTGRAAFISSYAAHACRYPWGALSLVIDQWDNSLALVSQRLEAVLSFWEQLDTLRYQRRREYDLTNLMLYLNAGTLRMWVDVLRGSAKDVLRTAIDRMRNASEDEIRTRLFRRLYEIADTEPELKHREWLKSPGVLHKGLIPYKATYPDWYEALTTGDMDAMAGFLRYVDKKYPHG